MKRYGAKRYDTKGAAMKYEVPELSERFGVYIIANTLQDAQRVAIEHGCDAVWEVQLLRGLVPVLAGRIHAYQGGRWQPVQSTGRCTCGGCTAH
jgi:hypothetical protein